MSEYEDTKAGGMQYAADLIKENRHKSKGKLIKILETKAEENRE